MIEVLYRSRKLRSLRRGDVLGDMLNKGMELGELYKWDEKEVIDY